MKRATRGENAACVTRTLLDAPFYARSMLQSQVLGESVTAMHESLDLRRFAAPCVRAVLPFRMPRALHRSGSTAHEPASVQ